VRALVTGATGLIGNNLVRLLCARGDTVRVLVREGSDPRPLAELAVERAHGDVRDPAAVARAVAGVDVVFHAAARVGIGTRALADFRAVNVGGAAAVARAARAAGTRMVHVSSVDALGFGTRDRPADENAPPDPAIAVPYVISKREAEAAVAAEVGRGLDAVIVSPVFVLGPWDWKPSSGRLLIEIARGAGRFAPPGGNDFAHAEDVARGVLAAAERGRRGERYILGGEALGYRDAFTLFAGITGGPPPIATAPAFAVRAVGRAGSVVGRLLGREPALNAASAALGCLPHHFDDAKARRELGYRSRSAREAATAAWTWLTARGYDKNQNNDSRCRAPEAEIRG
jgi:dihydroflavonol-4-reductase